MSWIMYYEYSMNTEYVMYCYVIIHDVTWTETDWDNGEGSFNIYDSMIIIYHHIVFCFQFVTD